MCDCYILKEDHQKEVCIEMEIHSQHFIEGYQLLTLTRGMLNAIRDTMSFLLCHNYVGRQEIKSK